MPLDTGRITELDRSVPAADGADFAIPAAAPDLQTGADLGEALRAVREHRRLSVEDVAALTRVRRVYIAAIEDMQLDKLPSRPFTIGYIRAYAAALGLDPEAAVERFKSDEPVLDEPLRAPVGVGSERDPRLAAFGVAAALILTAIVLWNVAQRLMAENAPPLSTAPADVAVQPRARTGSGAVALGAPLPAPVESTTPPPYETPGLAEAGADGHGNVAPPSVVGAIPADHVPIDPNTLPASFTPDGAIYDSGAHMASAVTLQALRPSALIIRGPDGAVYFARQLTRGEAYRVPQIAGVVVDVTDPEAFQVFSRGRSRGVLPGTQVAAGKLEAPPPATTGPTSPPAPSP